MKRRLNFSEKKRKKYLRMSSAAVVIGALRIKAVINVYFSKANKCKLKWIHFRIVKSYVIPTCTFVWNLVNTFISNIQREDRTATDLVSRYLRNSYRGGQLVTFWEVSKTQVIF